MGIEEEKGTGWLRDAEKPRWRYHWGNHVPEGLVERQTEVMFRCWVKGKHINGLGPHFLHDGGGLKLT